MKNDKKIKIHIKNNHWAPGSFPIDAEKMPIKDRDNHIINKLSEMEKSGAF